MLLQIIPGGLYLAALTIVVIFSIIDRNSFNKKKKAITLSSDKVSFIVPCYNDEDLVSGTLKSIYDTLGPEADVLVIDDASSDGSFEILKELKEKYGFTLTRNEKNMGKTETLNRHYTLARNDIIVFLDADVILNDKALHDALFRLKDKSVGAVSCPYRPINKGFLPLMQSLEYNMLSLIQGAYNFFSAVSLWGGFIVVKKEALVQAGAFTKNAITEDLDLAFKLNKKGWKVRQSFFYVGTYVPDTFKVWFKQKKRWSSGGVQCFITHYKIWIKNPVHIFFLFSYLLFILAAVFSLGKDVIFFGDIVGYFRAVHSQVSLIESIELSALLFVMLVLKDLFWVLAFTLFSLPYVIPLIRSPKDLYLILLVVPFSIIYIPLFTFTSIYGGASYLFNRKKLRGSNRAW